MFTLKMVTEEKVGIIQNWGCVVFTVYDNIEFAVLIMNTLELTSINIH